MFFPFELIFILMVFMGTVMSLSSSSWFGVWVGMEINMLGLIPIFTFYKKVGEIESSITYFLTQSIGSAWVLFGVMLSYFYSSFFVFCLFIGVILKLGAGPFYFWVPKVMMNLSWFNCMVLSTWQKVIPLVVFFLVGKMNYFSGFMGGISALIGSIGGINQNKIRELMAFSSISHIGWMISLCFIGGFYMFIYFFVYCLLSVLVFIIIGLSNIKVFSLDDLGFNKFKLGQFMVILSLAGFPPFLGFFVKLMSVILISFYFMLVFLLIFSSFLSLYYYMILGFSLCINMNCSWLNYSINNMVIWMVLFFVMNLFSMILILLLFYYYALIFFY